MKTIKQTFRATSMSLIALLFFTTIQAQVVKPFTPRSPQGTNTTVHKLKGDFEMIGNTNMESQNSNNNSSHMIYIDVDNDPNTVNSSSATLEYSNENGADHSNTHVAFAGLYWTGRAHDGSNSPHTAILSGGISAEKLNNDNFNGYSLTITSSNDNSSNTSSSDRRVSTYTFTPQGNGDVVVFKYYTWRTSIIWSVYVYHHKVTVQVGNAPAVDLVLSNNASSSNSASANMSYAMGSGNNAFLITQLHKHRTNNNINSNFKVGIESGQKILDKQVVKFKKAGESYQTITANSNDIYFPSTEHGLMYSAFADVTSYVQQHGAGEYTLADLMILEGNGGSTGFYGGWALVVVYSNPMMNSRNITVFDGHAYVPGSITASHEINISGFETVPVGQVNMKIGYMAGEGDKSIEGDYLQILKASDNSWVNLSHAENSTNNFFNSSIVTNGVRTPTLSNNFGIDIGVLNLNNINNEFIANSATTTKFRYGTTQDTYIIPLFVFGVEAFSTKGRVVNDANGLTDGQVNESGSLIIPQVYAHILDENGAVMRVEPVDHVTGNFELSGLGNGDYEIILSEFPNPINTLKANFNQSLQKGWQFIGESRTGGTPDGTVDGSISFTMAGGDVTGLVFGLDRVPDAISNLNNPTGIDYAGDGFYSVPPGTFNSIDYDGHIINILIQGIPLGVSQIKVNGILYDSSTFPVGGINVPTDILGEPLQTIEFYLTQSNVNEVLKTPFLVTDNAGFECQTVEDACVLISSILPVELVAFDAYNKGKVNILDWTTHIEINNKGFHVERSEDAKYFKSIGFVAGLGREIANNYSFIDEKPFQVTYYRLKQEDLDGSYTYSEVRRVYQGTIQNNVNVYPNPTRDIIHIKQDRMAEKEAVLVNVTGQVVEVIKLTEEVTLMSMSHLPRGVYYLQVGETVKRVVLN